MGFDASSICDILVDVMCRDCPNSSKCQNDDDEYNYDQMAECMGLLTMGEYPDDFEPLHKNCCVCGKPAEGVKDDCQCQCPTCGEFCFDDSEFGDHNECYDCHKKHLNGG